MSNLDMAPRLPEKASRGEEAEGKSDLSSLQDHRRSESPSHTKGDDPKREISTLHLPEQGEGDARSTHSDGMAQGDGAAVDIDLLSAQPQDPLDRQILRREGLIDFDELHICKGNSPFF